MLTVSSQKSWDFCMNFSFCFLLADHPLWGCTINAQCHLGLLLFSRLAPLKMVDLSLALSICSSLLHRLKIQPWKDLSFTNHIHRYLLVRNRNINVINSVECDLLLWLNSAPVLMRSKSQFLHVKKNLRYLIRDWTNKTKQEPNQGGWH